MSSRDDDENSRAQMARRANHRLCSSGVVSRLARHRAPVIRDRGGQVSWNRLRISKSRWDRMNSAVCRVSPHLLHSNRLSGPGRFERDASQVRSHAGQRIRTQASGIPTHTDRGLKPATIPTRCWFASHLVRFGSPGRPNPGPWLVSGPSLVGATREDPPLPKERNNARGGFGWGRRLGGRSG